MNPTETHLGICSLCSFFESSGNLPEERLLLDPQAALVISKGTFLGSESWVSTEVCWGQMVARG